MKLKHVVIRNFKGVKEVEFPTADAPNALGNLTAILGDNGSGKTSILQAIALVLSLATRRTKAVASFDWPGFVPERLGSMGETYVELRVEFDDEELAQTTELFWLWQQSDPPEIGGFRMPELPDPKKTAILRFERGVLSVPDTAYRNTPLHPGLFQFMGRHYWNTLGASRPAEMAAQAPPGEVYWFDQYRNLGTATTLAESTNGGDTAWLAGVERLREYLIGWWAYHTSPLRNGNDYLPHLEIAINRVFPGTHFRGIRPRSDLLSQRPRDFLFLIERDGRTYDLAEMSSGEQAVFPLAYEFVRLNIQRSVVLIDELELHLHPPEQLRLLSSLPKLAPNCQFIITTHSEFLSTSIPNDREIRLDGGARCI